VKVVGVWTPYSLPRPAMISLPDVFTHITAVITPALGKRDGEHLCRQVIGDPVSNPGRQILVNPAEIAPEDRLEPFWLGP
jgi:hypothetical protein